MHDCSSLHIVPILPNFSECLGPFEPTHLPIYEHFPLPTLANDNARRRSGWKKDVLYCVFVSQSAAYLLQYSMFRSEAARELWDNRHMIKRNKADRFRDNTVKNSFDSFWINWHRVSSQNLLDFYHISLFDEQALKCCEVGRRMGTIIGMLVSFIHYAASLANFWSVTRNWIVVLWGGTLWKQTICFPSLCLEFHCSLHRRCRHEPQTWASYCASN